MPKSPKPAAAAAATAAASTPPPSGSTAPPSTASTPPPSGSTAPPSVTAVSIKLPEWWPDSAALWFSQAEAQFAIKGVVDQRTKFFYVISALDNATASRIEDIVNHPPAFLQYDALKERLIACFALSDYQRLERLFSPRGLGDRRPSALMDEILSSASGFDVGSDVLKFLFLSRLPDNIRQNLIEDDFSDTRAVSRRADQLWSACPTSSVCQVSPPADDSEQCVQQQPPPVNVVSSRKPPPRRHNNNNSRPVQQQQQQRSVPVSAPPRQFGMGLCYFHRMFGDEARRCELPCSFNQLAGNARAGRWN